MGNLFMKRKRSKSKDNRTGSPNERCSFTISNSSDTSVLSTETLCVSNALDFDDVNNILETGDLTRMHLINEWITDVNRKGEWKEKANSVADAVLRRCCNYFDGASLHALTHLSHFQLLASPIISIIGTDDLGDQSHFLAMLRDALLPHVRPEHETALNWRLLRAINEHHPMSLIEFFDALWWKSTSNEFNELHTLKNFYKKILSVDTINYVHSTTRRGVQEGDITNAMLMKFVIHIAISRHILLMLDFINDSAHKDTFDPYSKSKLLEWTLCSNLPMNKIHILKHIDSDSAALVKTLNIERQFLTSQISTTMTLRQLFFTNTETVCESVVAKILKRMDICKDNCSDNEKAKAILWLLSKICKALEEKECGATWEPILVGSAAECTQAFFIDEFDYVLLTNSKLKRRDIKQALKTAALELTNTHHPRLALEHMNLCISGNYPCLYITWVDVHLRNTRISVDLVPAWSLAYPVTLPHHNFLPVPREQQPGDATKPKSIKSSGNGMVNSEFI